MSDKIFAYIGFAIKKKSIVYGLDNILTFRKRIYLILIDSKLAENSSKKINEYAKLKKINLVVCLNSLEMLVNKTNCKVVGITDKQLANVIFANIDTNYIVGVEVKPIDNI